MFAYCQDAFKYSKHIFEGRLIFLIDYVELHIRFEFSLILTYFTVRKVSDRKHNKSNLCVLGDIPQSLTTQDFIQL